jgi:4-amino-4-deoxy-L-arabinose transferase-like glycosyltransferase
MKKGIVLILVLGLILRLIQINQSLWLDEAIGALVVKGQSLKEILTEFPLHDNHPPLYYLSLKLWSDLFGYSEAALRALSVLFGLGTIYLTYKIGKSFGSRLGVIAAVLMTTSQFHIYYSQEARMYMMAAFLGALAFYLFLKEKWAFFSLAITLLVFTDYVPIFFLPVFWIIGVVSKKPVSWWKKLALSHVPLIILGILWIPTFISQSQAGKWLLTTLPAWKEVAGGASFKQAILVWSKFTFGRISLSDKTIYYPLVAFFSFPFVFAFVRAWKKRKKVNSLWFYLGIPLVLGFLASFLFPAFIYFRFVYVLPAFFLLSAWGITKFKGKKYLLLLGWILLGNLVSWLIYIGEPNQQREDWRGATAFVEAKVKDKEMVVFNFTEAFAPYQWYSKGEARAQGLTDSISATTATRQRAMQVLTGVKGIYYFEYLWELHDPGRIVANTLIDEGFIEVTAFDFPGVGIIRYLKRP